MTTSSSAPPNRAARAPTQILAANGLCACMGDSKVSLEIRRVEKFKDAIKTYEWPIAETLAWSEEEMQDLDDSKLRVELMNAAKVQGDFEKAHSYAITEAERDEIDAYRGTVSASLGPISSEQELAASKMQARICGSQVRASRARGKSGGRDEAVTMP